MKALRAAATAILLTALIPAYAAVNGNEKSQRLVGEGNALIVQRQYAAAAEKFEAARKESPDASSPLSSFAYMLCSLASGGTSPEAKAQLQRAREWAEKALAISSDDPLALEVIRALDDDTPRPGYVENAAANQAFNEAEVLFHSGQYEAARLKYRAAYQADPKFVKAQVMEGDTYFAEKNWAGAELMFQMATETDPLDSQAWRFLADARDRQDDGAGAMYAVLHAIAAMPSEATNWERLKLYVAKSDKPMARLGLERKVWIQRDRKTISIAPDVKGTDNAIWLSYAMARVADVKDGKPESPFQTELRAWRTALAVANELAEKGQPAPQAPALLALQKLHAAGQLEAAVFILMYKEAYRPEFEAWKKAHPQGVQEFTDKWRLMP